MCVKACPTKIDKKVVCKEPMHLSKHEEEELHENDDHEEDDHINHGKGLIPCPTIFTPTIAYGYFCFIDITDMEKDKDSTH